MTKKAQNIIGRRFERLLVIGLISRGDIRSKDRYWCKCDCKNLKEIAQMRITAKKATCYRSKRPLIATQSEPAVLSGPLIHFLL